MLIGIIPIIIVIFGICVLIIFIIGVQILKTHYRTHYLKLYNQNIE